MNHLSMIFWLLGYCSHKFLRNDGSCWTAKLGKKSPSWSLFCSTSLSVPSWSCPVNLRSRSEIIWSHLSCSVNFTRSWRIVFKKLNSNNTALLFWHQTWHGFKLHKRGITTVVRVNKVSGKKMTFNRTKLVFAIIKQLFFQLYFIHKSQFVENIQLKMPFQVLQDW